MVRVVNQSVKPSNDSCCFVANPPMAAPGSDNVRCTSEQNRSARPYSKYINGIRVIGNGGGRLG